MVNNDGFPARWEGEKTPSGGWFGTVFPFMPTGMAPGEPDISFRGARRAQNARMREEAYAFPTPEEAATTLNCGAPETKIFAPITSSPISGIASPP